MKCICPLKPIISLTLTLTLTLLSACCVSVLAATPPGHTWTGLVTYVVDGDTVRVRPLQGGKPVSVRVNGIDAPEICQDGGSTARDALKRRALGQRVVVHGVGRDDYGRLLAQIVMDDDDLGGWMVEAGHAWSYRYRGQPGPYAAQQHRAQAAGRGLFASGGVVAVYPAVFRKEHGSCRRS